MRNLMASVKQKDPVGIETARVYGSTGFPQFMKEAKDSNIFLRLEIDYDWPVHEAREIMSLIDKARVLWNSLQTWYEQQNKKFYQRFLKQALENRKH